jgi:hypothetical protein
MWLWLSTVFVRVFVLLLCEEELQQCRKQLTAAEHERDRLKADLAILEVKSVYVLL